MYNPYDTYSTRDPYKIPAYYDPRDRDYFKRWESEEEEEEDISDRIASETRAMLTKYLGKDHQCEVRLTTLARDIIIVTPEMQYYFPAEDRFIDALQKMFDNCTNEETGDEDYSRLENALEELEKQLEE